MDNNELRNDNDIASEDMTPADDTTKLHSKNFETQSNDDNYDVISGARHSAIKILSRFERSDSYIEKLLESEFRIGNLSALDKGLLNEIVHGVVRWKAKLDWILVGFYHGDYLKCLNIVKNALRVALYQIIYLDRIPIPAAINESVEIVKRIQGEKTAGIVNGVLRNIARNIDNIRYPDKNEDLPYYLSVMFSHPRWMVKRWIDRFGEIKTEKLLYVNNRRPHNTIRINKLKASVEDIVKVLKSHDMSFFPSPYMKESILVKSYKPEIHTLDIFKDGSVTIQDTSASLAARLAAPQEGMTLIDMCAAPGGKSFYLAEMMNDKGRVIAVDKYLSKMRFIEEGSARLGLTSIETLSADATKLDIEEKVDIVFADVPCSGLGTLSKKPDIKWKREREDIYVLVELQRRLLQSAVSLLKPGGVLVYSTCTIEPEENTENIQWFLENNPEFEIDPAEKYLPAEVCNNGFMEVLPHEHYIDGAFAARLIKKA